MIGEFSGHKGGKFYRILFAFAILWNVIGTGMLFLFSSAIFKALGLLEPVHPVFVSLAFGYEVIFGIGYWMVYRDMYRNSDIIFIGIFAKLLFGILAIYFTIYSSLSEIFLAVGLVNIVFAFLFILAYFHSTQFVDRGSATILPVEPKNGFKNRVLILYFSMTEQTRKAAEAIRKGLEKEGITVDTNIIEPEKPFPFPFPSRLGFFKLSIRVWLNRKIRIKALDFNPDDYDMIILGSQTWWMSDSLPIRAIFNDKNNRKYFEGRNVAVYVVCRGLWQGNLRKVLKKLHNFGANVVDSIPLQHNGKEPFRLITLGAYLLTGKEHKPGWMKSILYKYGFDEEEIARAEMFGRRMGKLLGT